MAADSSNLWKLGLFVALSGTVAAAGILWLGANRLQRESIRSVTYFDESVQGLDVGAPVKFRGVTIGSVVDVAIGPDQRHVEVTSDLYVDRLGPMIPGGTAGDAGEFPLVPRRVRMQISSAGITGVKFVQADIFDPLKYPMPALPFEPPWNYVPAVPSTFKSLEEGLITAMERLPDLYERGMALLERLNEKVDVIDTAGLSERSSELLDETAETMRALRELAEKAGAEDGPLYGALTRLDGAAREFAGAVRSAQVGQTSQAMRGAANNVYAAADTFRTGTANLREAIQAIAELAALLERDPSAVLRGKAAERSPAESLR